MTDKNVLHATPLAEKGMAPEIDMGPRRVGDLDLEQSRMLRARQQSRSRMMGIILVGLCILFFAITVVKVGVWG
jgi:hypothetical protein